MKNTVHARSQDSSAGRFILTLISNSGDLRAAGPVTALVLLLLCLCTFSQGVSAADEPRFFTALPAACTVQLTGFTRARATMELVSEHSGKVTEVNFDVGDTIPANSVFVRTDPTFLELDLKRNLASQARAMSEIDYFDREAARYRTLVQRQTAAVSALDKLEQELTRSRHTLHELEVEEAVLREKLARTAVPAPSGWRVIRRFIEPGEWISAGQTAAVLGDFRKLLIPYALSPDEYHSLMELDPSIVLTLPDQGDRQIKARIFRVSPAFDPVTRKINVELAVSEGMPVMRGGFRCRLTISLPDRSGAVLAPKTALEQRYEDFWLVRKSGRKVRVLILGDGPDQETVRITSPDIRPGEKFYLHPPR